MRRAVVLACAVAALAVPGTARAYRYELRARTIGQLYQLPTMHLFGGDLWLERRRFTQTITLSVWDVGDLAAARARRRPGAVDRGPTVWFTGHLRLDHDFGAWTLGDVATGGRTVDALDLIPELAAQSVGFYVPYGYLAVDNLAGFVDLRAGRQLRLDALDGGAIDGVTARVHTGTPVLVEVEGGLRVRDASPLAPYGLDLDGTSDADCTEYVEGPTPGTGAWQLIDRSRVPGESQLGSDLAYCPQRAQLMPTVGVALETDALRRVHARVAYRRSQSRTTGRIGAIDRLDHPDTGLYPDEVDQAPAWGVNEEHVSAAARAAFTARRVRIEPWAHARYSLVHAVVDEAGAGVRLARGAHRLEPAVSRSRPTFDADSIWSVFAISPSIDARLSYAFAPAAGAARGHARAWVRRYDPDDTTAAATAGGGALSAEVDLAADWRAQAEVFADDGHGGRRTGGLAAARWRTTRRVALTARAGVVDVATDTGHASGTSATAALATLWQIDDGIALTATSELVSSPLAPLSLRTFAVVDLAFEPEM